MSDDVVYLGIGSDQPPWSGVPSHRGKSLRSLQRRSPIHELELVKWDAPSPCPSNNPPSSKHPPRLIPPLLPHPILSSSRPARVLPPHNPRPHHSLPNPSPGPNSRAIPPLASPVLRTTDLATTGLTPGSPLRGPTPGVPFYFFPHCE